MPPAKAAIGVVISPNGVAPITIAVTAPKAAPLETPMMLGSASGLRKMPCSTAPDIASARSNHRRQQHPRYPDCPDHRILLAGELDIGVDAERGAGRSR